MLKDWDFAQFFPNWIPPAGATDGVVAQPTETNGDHLSLEGKSSSSSPSTSNATPPRFTHRRNESDSALNGVKASSSSSSPTDPLFSSRNMWAGRQRICREPLPTDDPVSLTEFSRKSSQLELRSHKSASTAVDFAPGVCPAPPRREKTDLLDLRRQELKKELEDRRREAGSSTVSTGGTSASTPRVRQSLQMLATKNTNLRPPLLKSTSEPCAAPLTLFRDHLQVRDR